MGNILDRIISNQDRQKATLIGYLPIGFPNPDKFRKLISIAFEEGVDIMELGVPYEDPYLDGEVIREAYKSVFSNGNTIGEFIELGGKALAGCNGPGYAMAYSESVYQYGLEGFFKIFRDCGYEGMLVPNSSMEQHAELSLVSKKNKLGYIGFIHAEADAKEILSMAHLSDSFLYLQGISGSTGQSIKFDQNLVQRYALVKEIIKETKLPVLVGFGIRNAHDIMQVQRLKFDGAILGTSFLKSALEPEKTFRKFVRSLSQATLNGEA